jgi:hypothetical protein
MDHYQHAKNTLEDSIASAKEAMRRIEEIGVEDLPAKYANDDLKDGD